MVATTLHIRVDEDLNGKAAATLDGLGLSVSDAVQLFLERVVVEGGLPVALKVPSARTSVAIAEAEDIAHARFSSVEDLIDAVQEDASSEKGRDPPQE